MKHENSNAGEWGAFMRRAYNTASESYRSGVDPGEYYRCHVEALRSRVDRGSVIVDLGCGCGVPLARDLSSDYTVIGVDISDTQLSRAKRLAPRAQYVQADLAQFELREESVSAVVALFSLIHLPLDKQERLITRVASWLRPAGIFLFVGGGHAGWVGSKPNWHGVEMMWWQASAHVYDKWVGDAGFSVEDCAVSDRGERGHSVFLCKR